MKAKKKEKLIIKAAEKFSGLTFKEIKSDRKFQALVSVRNAIMFLIDKNCNYSITKTGLIVNRDHATVLHAKKTIMDVSEFKDKVHYPAFKGISILFDKMLSDYYSNRIKCVVSKVNLTKFIVK